MAKGSYSESKDRPLISKTEVESLFKELGITTTEGNYTILSSSQAT